MNKETVHKLNCLYQELNTVLADIMREQQWVSELIGLVDDDKVTKIVFGFEVSYGSSWVYNLEDPRRYSDVLMIMKVASKTRIDELTIEKQRISTQIVALGGEV